MHDQVLRHALAHGVDGEEVVLGRLRRLSGLARQRPLLLGLRRHDVVEIITTKAEAEGVVCNILG